MTLISCINIVYTCIGFTMKCINENIHTERIKSLNFLNQFLLEFLGFAPAISSTIFSCRVDIFLLLDGLSPELCHISLQSKHGQNKLFESVSFPDMKHRCDCTACSTLLRNYFISIPIPLVINFLMKEFCMCRLFYKLFVIASTSWIL